MTAPVPAEADGESATVFGSGEHRFVVRDVTDPWRLRALEDLQAVCFGYGDRDVLPGTMLRISAMSGGVVLAAYPLDEGEEGVPVGHAFGFPALRDDVVWHHSHQLVVRPEWRGRGVSVALKQVQRARVLAQGLTRMTWTFDPLLARNARLNLGKLGARAVAYLPEFYAMGPARGSAFPADRLLVEWDLRRAEVGHAPPRPVGWRRLEVGPNGWPGAVKASGSGEPQLVEVPTDLELLDEAGRLAWRLALREALGGALAAGLVVTDLAREGGRAFYVLTAPDG